MRFPNKFLNSLTLNLTEMLIWKENDSVKYGDFPDQSQSFRFFSSLARTKTNYIIIGLDRPPTKLWTIYTISSRLM